MSQNIIDHRLFDREGREVRFSDETMEKVKTIISRYPPENKKSALLPVLHIAQEELGGYLSVDVQDYVATLLGLQPIEVYEVATFYTQYYLDKVGKYVIEVCRTGPCAICGGEDITDYLSAKLNVKDGETTADGLFTLRTVECLGACGSAPVMQINTEFYEFLTKEKIDKTIEDLSQKANLDKPKESKWVEKF
jgi:NADH-quinone oxidoreductase subunit E